MAALAVAGSGCTSPVDRQGSTLPGECQREAPLIEPVRTDLLFVIDDSNSMREEQEGIREELPAFIEALRAGGGVTQDFRVGVITTSVYQQAAGVPYAEFPEAGRLQAVPLPDGGVSAERFVEAQDPQLLEKFRALVVRGTGGSAQETPFEAVRLAVTPAAACNVTNALDGGTPCVGDVPLAQGGNQGFLRDGARLLVVVVSDEEDCSSTQRPPPVTVSQANNVDECAEGSQAAQLTSVEQYVSLFQGLRDGTGAPREVLWAAIAPVARTDERAAIDEQRRGSGSLPGAVPNVDCPTSFGPGFRHRAMAERFASPPDATGKLENLASICSTSPQTGAPDYRQTLVDIAALTIPQELEIMNVPDEDLLVVQVTRASGAVQTCTTTNDGIDFEPAAEGQPARITFRNQCLRAADDQAVSVRLFCAS